MNITNLTTSNMYNYINTCCSSNNPHIPLEEDNKILNNYYTTSNIIYNYYSCNCENSGSNGNGSGGNGGSNGNGVGSNGNSGSGGNSNGIVCDSNSIKIKKLVKY